MKRSKGIGGMTSGKEAKPGMKLNEQAANQAEARQAPTNSIQLFFLPLKREEK